jgi:hypothetical protein
VAERRKGNLLCVVYKDGGKKPILLSTEAKAGYQDIINRRGQEVRRPKVVVKYNSSMGGVDLSDARLYKYLAERRTMKWTLKVAFSLFGRALLNSFIMYSMNTDQAPKLTRHQFMMQVVEGLAGNFYPQKRSGRKRTAGELAAARADPPLQPEAPQAAQANPHKLTKIEGGRVRNCAEQHDARKRSRYECRACNLGFCTTCFHGYHERMGL